MNRVSVFKYIIKEFHEFKLPDIIPRVLELPKTNKIISLVGSRRVGKRHWMELDGRYIFILLQITQRLQAKPFGYCHTIVGTEFHFPCRRNMRNNLRTPDTRLRKGRRHLTTLEENFDEAAT